MIALHQRSAAVRYVCFGLTQNPTLSLSFPPNLAWSSQLGTSAEAVNAMLHTLRDSYGLHVMVYAPNGVAPPLSCERKLMYSTGAGRAMLARALQCQCHVELVFISPEGQAAWDGHDDVPTYLSRLDQLAQVVDVLMVIVVPVAQKAESTIPLATLSKAWSQHAVSKRASAQWTELPRSSSLQDVVGPVLEQRASWT